MELQQWVLLYCCRAIQYFVPLKIVSNFITVCLYSCLRYCKSLLFCAVWYCRMWHDCLYYNFPHYLINGTIFWNILFHIMLVLILSTTFVWNTFHSKKNCGNLRRSSYTTHYYCQILREPEFSKHFFGKSSNIKFHENPSTGSRVISCRKTDGRTCTVHRTAEHNTQNTIILFTTVLTSAKHWTQFLVKWTQSIPLWIYF